VDQTVTGPSGTQVTHTFTTTGSNSVTVTATDKDGGVSAPATLAVGVQTVALGPDPANPGQTALFVGGTTGNDKIIFIPAGRNGVRLRVNGVDQGTFNPTGSLVVFAQAGNDNVQIAGSIRLLARIHGDAGNDRIKAGKGAAVLDGGEGDDLLIGGKSNDILLGGAGADRLVGGPGDDILIAGSTTSDDTALGLLLGQWNSGQPYSARVAALAASLSTGTGGSITDDGVQDILTGASGMDWYLTADAVDLITGLTRGDVVNAPTTSPAPAPGNGNGGGNGGGHGNGRGRP
jgi:Ca2+-binding RTX toxin-like protein